MPKEELADELVCHCKFYRQYQFPCAHIFQWDTVSSCITPSHWRTLASYFDECGYEVYEGFIKTYATKDVHEAIGGPSKHMLEVREVLDHIKTRFYDLEELTADWEPENRKEAADTWVGLLRKYTGPIRKRAARRALEKLKDNGHNVNNLELPADFVRQDQDGDESSDGEGIGNCEAYNSEAEG